MSTSKIYGTYFSEGVGSMSWKQFTIFEKETTDLYYLIDVLKIIRPRHAIIPQILFPCGITKTFPFFILCLDQEAIPDIPVDIYAVGFQEIIPMDNNVRIPVPKIM